MHGKATIFIAQALALLSCHMKLWRIILPESLYTLRRIRKKTLNCQYCTYYMLHKIPAIYRLQSYSTVSWRFTGNELYRVGQKYCTIMVF